MKFNSKVLFSTGLGVISLILLVYFYFLQRDFSRDYKSVVEKFQVLENSFGQLNYEILQSSLFAYHNQDEIANRVDKIETNFEMLKSEAILQQPQYVQVKTVLENLNRTVEEYVSGINRYMMLNAGYKNSFVFLSTHAEESVKLFPPGAHIHAEIHKIVNALSVARRMLDADYLNSIAWQLESLSGDDEYAKDQREFMETFILHAKYITKNFPDYISSINRLLQAQAELRLNEAQKLFVSVAQSDVKTLDQLALLLFILIIGAIALISILFYRSGKENIHLQRLQQDLRRSLSHDQLTGLLNRFSFDSMLSETDSPTLLLINIDRFKHINDFYGTRTGDVILNELASLIQLQMLKDYNPLYFRLGGDDFGIVLYEIEEETAIRIAKAIDTTIEAYPFIVDGIEIYISVAISVNHTAPYMENADMALKYLKEYHNEKVIYFDESMRLKEKAQHNLATMKLIKSAVENNQIVPHFQPIVNLYSREIEKYEALMRIELEDGTLLFPGDFLAVAVQTTYYRDMTRIMLEKAFKRFQKFSYRFSINLSMQDLMNDQLMETLINVLESDLETAKRLDIELLESEELDDYSYVTRFIKRIKSYGCRISIDDFGSGYSNFAYVNALPIDVLKIDGSLVRSILEDPRSLQTVKTIVVFARNLQLEIVAEFVENEEIAEMLTELGVTYGQGYYFGKPSTTII